MEETAIMAFWDELEKIGMQARSPGSTFASKTVGAPRAKVTPKQMDRAPTLPNNLGPKLVGPNASHGPRQNYSQPKADIAPATNPMQGAEARQVPPPNVVFGVR
jgi:hypothetical protein